MKRKVTFRCLSQVGPLGDDSESTRRRFGSPPGDDSESTWRRLGIHLELLLNPLGVHLESFLIPLGAQLPPTPTLHTVFALPHVPIGVHLGPSWSPLGDHLGSTWRPLGVHSETIWGPPGDESGSTWGSPGDHSETISGPFGGVVPQISCKASLRIDQAISYMRR